MSVLTDSRHTGSWNGALKAVTFSYDDGVRQDGRLIELFDKYGVRGTFNLNSGLMGRRDDITKNGVTVGHEKFTPEEAKRVYEGHEIAVHTVTHPNLTEVTAEEVLTQVEDDRAALSALAGYDIQGMAYPGGGVNSSPEIADIIKNGTPLRYARTTVPSYDFEPQSDLYLFKPTLHHTEFDKLFELGRKFIDLKPDSPKIFYIWGHSYEFDFDDSWALFEDFLRDISGKDDIFYGTNSQTLL